MELKKPKRSRVEIGMLQAGGFGLVFEGFGSVGFNNFFFVLGWGSTFY